MNLLQISPFGAYPPTSGGRQRIHGLMTGHGEWSVDRVATRALTADEMLSADRTDAVEIDPDYTEITYGSRLRTVLNLPLRTTLDFQGVYLGFLLNPFVASLSRAHPIHEYLARDPDLVCVEYPWLVAYVADRVECPLVYSSHNVELEFYDDLVGESALGRLRGRIAARERAALDAADLVVGTSRRDGELFERHYGYDGPYHVAPNGASPPPREDVSIAPNAGGDGPFRACFVGAGSGPNATAARAVVSIAETLADTDARIRFDLVGSTCEYVPADVPDSVTLHGHVEDLTATLADVDVGLNPITTGGGTNVKVADYLAHGLAVVTTPFGSRGIPGTSEEHYLVRDLDGFATTLRRMERGEIDVASLGEAGRALAEGRLDWETISTELFTDVFSALVSRSASAD